jgi:hypothetical protein
MRKKITRRDFVKRTVVASTGTTLALTAASAQAQQEAAKPAAAGDGLPMGKIGGIELSRLMLGGNLISGYSHSRDLRYVSTLMKQYNTEAKILETLALAEERGINSVNTAVWDDNTAIEKHRKEGGKIKWIAAANPMPNGELTQVDRAIDAGADIVYIQGACADRLFHEGKLDLIVKEVNYIKSSGLPAGVGAHTLDVIKECEKAKIDADFYQKTLHALDYPSAPSPDERGDVGSWDNGWCKDPRAVVEFMATVKKPWIAFKVMAAGAILPKVAFPYTFDSGADFILAGIFDFQIDEDVRIAKEAFAGVKRTRPWCA